MDISTLKPSERQVEIIHPRSKLPVGIRVSLLHIDDPKMKKLKRSIQDEKNRLEVRGKYLKAEDFENNMSEVIFNAMASWEWYNPTGTVGDEKYDENQRAEWRGDPSPQLNKKNVFDVFETLPWFRDLLQKEIEDSEAFYQA